MERMSYSSGFLAKGYWGVGGSSSPETIDKWGVGVKNPMPPILHDPNASYRSGRAALI